MRSTPLPTPRLRLSAEDGPGPQGRPALLPEQARRPRRELHCHGAPAHHVRRSRAASAERRAPWRSSLIPPPPPLPPPPLQPPHPAPQPSCAARRRLSRVARCMLHRYVGELEDEADAEEFVARWVEASVAAAKPTAAAAEPAAAVAEPAAAPAHQLWVLKPSDANRGEGIAVRRRAAVPSSLLPLSRVTSHDRAGISRRCCMRATRRARGAASRATRTSAAGCCSDTCRLCCCR